MHRYVSWIYNVLLVFWMISFMRNSSVDASVFIRVSVCLQEDMEDQKAGRQCHQVIRLQAMTTTAVTIAHHMEHIHQAMIIPATMITRHITVSHHPTGAAMPQLLLLLLPAMHLHILVCSCRRVGCFFVHFGRLPGA